jgi:hypothetical protein
MSIETLILAQLGLTAAYEELTSSIDVTTQCTLEREQITVTAAAQFAEHPHLLLGAYFKYRFLGHRQSLSVFNLFGHKFIYQKVTVCPNGYVVRFRRGTIYEQDTDRR